MSGVRPRRLPGALGGGLFWRTFLLIAALTLANLLAWFVSFRVAERTPRAQQIAFQLASAVNLTRAALVSAQPERRRELLADLARDESLRVDVPEPGDRVEPLPPGGLASEVAGHLRALLGPDTRVAGSVNDEVAFWVSFDIAGDDYWLVVDRERIDRQEGPNWALWTAVALALALAAAFATSRLVNRPLADLAGAIGRLARGAAPPRLPETGPEEIARLNGQFNRLADALVTLEADRALALAGISHDVRTPLTRLRMEVEMASVDAATRQSMVEDIEAIDRIVGQFVEFARGGSEAPVEMVDVDLALATLRERWRASVEAGEIAWETPADVTGLSWRGRRADFERIVDNLVENARRYARVGEGPARLHVAAEKIARGIRLVVRDHGPGVPPEELERLPRPFARLDAARGAPGAAGGSGLGLAIVERLAARHDGNVVLSLPADGGLAVEVTLPDQPRRAKDV